MADSWMSPQELNDDPKRWLDVRHELHESVLALMENVFPGFKQKLIDLHIHCFECEGKKPIEAMTIDKLKSVLVTGWIGEPGSPDIMLHIVEQAEEEPKIAS